MGHIELNCCLDPDGYVHEYKYNKGQSGWEKKYGTETKAKK